MSVQHKRKESMFFKAISQIVTEELTNANISYPTITDVKLSRDGSVLTAYVTFESNRERSFEHLNNAKGFIRKMLGSYSNQRIVPNIAFKLDTLAESASRVEEILKEIKTNDK